VKAPTPRQTLDSDRVLSSLELAAPVEDGEAVIRGWGRREGLRVHDDPRFGLVVGPTQTNDAIVAAGGAVGWRGPVGDRVRVDARVDGGGERFAPGTWLAAAAPPGATRATGGLALDLTMNVGARSAEGAARAAPLVIAASGRADVRSDASEGNARGEASPTGHLGAELALGRVVVASHVGRLARPPSFVELYGNRGAFLGNPSLRRESATTVDVGVRASEGRGWRRVDAELAGFGTWAEDLIVFVNEGAFGRARASNIGRAWLGGLEASARARVAPFEMRASYTGLMTENREDGACAATPSPGACARPALPGRPAHDFYADATVDLAFVRLRYGLDVVSGVAVDRLGAVQVPARVLQSAGVRVDVPLGREARGGAASLRLAFDVRNLFDVRTGTYDGALGPVREPVGDVLEYPLPGRTLLVSARFRGPAPEP
jgi:hypothetical protein